MTLAERMAEKRQKMQEEETALMAKMQALGMKK